MPCQRVTLLNGGRAIVCSPRTKKRCACGRPADLLCDWKVPTRQSGICDKPICSRCSLSPAPDKDLCQDHAREFERWKAAREGRG